MSPTTAEHSAPKPRKENPQPLSVAALPDALLNLRTAGAVGGVSTATIYRKAATDPTFPKLIRIGARCTRIRAGDLTAWLAAQGTQPTAEA